MAVGPMYFQPLTPQQANPGLYQAQQRAITQGQVQDNLGRMLQNAMLSQQVPYSGQMAQQDLQSKLLANALSQNTLNYAPQMSQADLNLKAAQAAAQNALPGLYGSEEAKNNADTGLINQQTKFYPYQVASNYDPITKMLIGSRLAQQFGGLPPVQNQSIAPSQPPVTNNLPGGALPNGVPYMPALASNNAQPAPVNAPSVNGLPANLSNLYGMQYANTIKSMGKDPTMGSIRSGAGGTYYNPFTGQTTTTDTSSNTTLDQRTVAAIQRVQPLINSLSNNLAPFQSAEGVGKLNFARGMNYLFPDAFNSLAPNLAQLPSMNAAGEQALQTAPESLLRAFGLPVTNESLTRMEYAVKPRFGETKQQYQQRLTNTMAELQQNAMQSNQRLKYGMNVDNNNTSKINNDPLGIR